MSELLQIRQNVNNLCATLFSLLQHISSDERALDNLQASLNEVVAFSNEKTADASLETFTDVATARTNERKKKRKPLTADDFGKKAAEEKKVEFAEDEKPIKAKRGRKAKSAEA